MNKVCTGCKERFLEKTALFCMFCGNKLSESPTEAIKDFLHIQKDSNPYRSSFGRWEVTTEGDCEGKTINNLGVFEGHLDDIAKMLATKSGYSLCFSFVEDKPATRIKSFDNPAPIKRKVHVSLDIDSKTWDMSAKQRVTFFKEMLKDRDIEITEGQYFASVALFFE